METDDAIDDHEGGNGKRNGEADGSRWLTDRVNRIHHRVGDPDNGHNADQHLGEHRIGVAQHVQQGDNHERDNVLQVVQVGAADALHHRVLLANIDAFGRILGILKGLK